MKIRLDFVSNSSSSSFICTYEDVKDSNMPIYGKDSTLTLEEYCQTYAWRDVFGYCFGKNILAMNINFVSNKMLQDNFATGIFGMLPSSSEQIFKRYCETLKSNSLKYDKKYSIIKSLEEEICNAIYEALLPTWGNVEFICIEASDDNGDEQAMENEFYYYANRFCRIFNNH